MATTTARGDMGCLRRRAPDNGVVVYLVAAAAALLAAPRVAPAPADDTGQQAPVSRQVADQLYAEALYGKSWLHTQT